MATVHLGRLLGPAGFSKIVAIKRLHPQFATDPEFLSMLIDEARLASSINHPNVVSSLDVVVEADELLLVMEYVQGESLAQLARLSRKSIASPPLGIIQRILADALDGLHAAHTASVGGRPLNIVHRDVSPQNIMVGANGVARVLDFGIAKAESQSQITRPGHVKGKFSYLSPEQMRGLPVDARTDVFAAGVVLWESLTGQRLFWTPGLEKTVERVLSAPIPAPSSKNPSVPAGLDRVVLKALERKSALRYQSAAEFAEALRAVPGEASRGEVAAWVTSTAAEVLTSRSSALRELEMTDEPAARFQPPAEPTAAWDDETQVERAEPSPAQLWDTKSASLTSGGTTRSLNPQLSVSPRSRRLVPVASALLVLSLAVIGFVSVRRHFSTSAAASPHAASSAIERKPVAAMPAPSGAYAERSTVLESAHAEAAASVPVVQLDQLPATPPLAKPRPSVPGVATVAVKAAHHEAAPASSVKCDTPYRVDASGVRRVRYECL